jgi:Tfp pilus assembly protein PilP
VKAVKSPTPWLCLALLLILSGCQSSGAVTSCEQYLDKIQRDDCKRRTILPAIEPMQPPTSTHRNDPLCYRKSTGEQVCSN